MRYLSEVESAALISHEIAYDAVKAAFISAATGEGAVFPALSAHASDSTCTFSVKSGSAPGYVGVKLGSYWPSNDALGIPRHGTTVILLDEVTGRLAAAVEAAQVNAFRTAAADAVAADALAHRDARTLTVFGNGHQALYECLALVKIRQIERINVVARNPVRGERFAAELVDRGFNAHLADARSACETADIITCATSSRGPLFDADWIRPGTHVASMGSDMLGKQELPPDLLSRARLFCDLPAQSVAIGEFQHIGDRIADGSLSITAIGDVLTGVATGRVRHDEITVFDSSGISLQDLAVAMALLDLSD
jgi:ornithine cyclodeaminase